MEYVLDDYLFILSRMRIIILLAQDDDSHPAQDEQERAAQDGEHAER